MAKTGTQVDQESIANDPEAECIVLLARLALLQAENIRLKADIDSLPEGWHAVKINENTIRINALSSNGDMCHWILSTEHDT